jgi:hypothetical protein
MTTDASQFYFGRIPAHGVGDDKDALYSMRVALPEAPVAPLPRFRYWPQVWGPLDQGRTSTCVAHALKAWMMTAPVVQTRPDRPPHPFEMYREFVKLDEWAFNDFEATGPDSGLQFGTSVRAAFKWAQSKGFVSEYRWALNRYDLAEWVLTKGSVVIGVNWTEGMMNPDAAGFVWADGRYLGGHSVCIVGHNRERGDYTFLNSWGANWGRNGRARIKAELLEMLLFQQGGEAVAGLETRLVQ